MWNVFCSETIYQTINVLHSRFCHVKKTNPALLKDNEQAKLYIALDCIISIISKNPFDSTTKSLKEHCRMDLDHWRIIPITLQDCPERHSLFFWPDKKSENVYLAWLISPKMLASLKEYPDIYSAFMARIKAGEIPNTIEDFNKHLNYKNSNFSPPSRADKTAAIHKFKRT